MSASSIRRKAVWGPKHTLAALVLTGTALAGGNIVWGTTAAGDSRWASSGLDDVMFPDAVQPLPSVSLEFGGPLAATVGGL